jgi:DNA-directed RNA polymerase
MLHGLPAKWGAILGRLVFGQCTERLRRPMQLLKLFEEAGAIAEEKGEYLSWTVPITGFPVVQEYTTGTVHKVWIQFGDPIGPKLNTGYYENTLQIAIMFAEDRKPAKGKQSLGASPNIVHSLDAAHLMLLVHRAPFPVTTVHDSFGCLFGDMDELYKLTRETFYELYKEDPLSYILEQFGMEFNNKGGLRLADILDSEYAFS